MRTNLKPDGYTLKTVVGRSSTGADDRGVLYGAFALLRKAAVGESIARLDEKSEPRVSERWVNHWDNLDGSIERGYGGRSIFWDNGAARADLSRVNDYGRMLASLGINGASINNVNVNPRILAPDFLPEISEDREHAAALGSPNGVVCRFREPAENRWARYL